MIHEIFSNYLYFLISPPNKEEILSVRNIKVEEIDTSNLEWIKECEVKVEILDEDKISSLLKPSLLIFFKELGIRRIPKITLMSSWKNTYTRGSFQEIHDHLHTVDDSHLSGCIFLDDYNSDASQFYFYNRHCSEVSEPWRMMMEDIGYPFKDCVVKPKKGDIIFFPSHMLHGVTPHRMDEPRTTISFNIHLSFS